MPKAKRIHTSAKESPPQSKTVMPPVIYWGADSTKRDGGKLPVYAGGVVWTVNAEPPSLAWIINAASGLAGWDLLAAAKKRDAALSRIDQIERWRWRKAQAEKNAQLPKEEQDPGLVGGLDDPYTAKRHEAEMHSAVSAVNDLDGGMEVNYWLHHALLKSPEASLKATYKHLRVIHTLPRVYDPAREPITPAIWADAKRDYQDILADAHAVAPPVTKKTKKQAQRDATVGALNQKLRCFITHGHDDGLKFGLKDYLQNTLKLPKPKILHQQPNHGLTIIEKFEEYSEDIDVAFVLLTPDDIGGLNAAVLKERARQNVIYELGVFVGRFGRKSGRVILLYKGALELPSDLFGVAYVDVSNGIEAAGESIRKELTGLTRRVKP